MHRNVEFIEKVPERFRKKLLRDLDAIEACKIQQLIAVYVFGSCAREELRSTSDLDLLILTKEKIADRVLAANLRSDLEDELDGVSTDVVFMNRASIEENTYFKCTVRKEMICVMEA